MRLYAHNGIVSVCGLDAAITRSGVIHLNKNLAYTHRQRLAHRCAVRAAVKVYWSYPYLREVQSSRTSSLFLTYPLVLAAMVRALFGPAPISCRLLVPPNRVIYPRGFILIYSKRL